MSTEGPEAPAVAPASRRVVAFLAVGTRGDVQPLAILAASLAKRGGGRTTVYFVTNREHKTLVEGPLTSAGVRNVEYLSLPPATPAALVKPPDEQDAHDQQRILGDERHREVGGVLHVPVSCLKDKIGKVPTSITARELTTVSLDVRRNASALWRRRLVSLVSIQRGIIACDAAMSSAALWW